jgi:hypothetical protein
MVQCYHGFIVHLGGVVVGVWCVRVGLVRAWDIIVITLSLFFVIMQALMFGCTWLVTSCDKK